MKSLIKAVAVAAVLAIPAVSFAQSNQPVTRAQVRAELVQLEQAGYNPSDSSDAHYPAAILAAEARVASRNDAAQNDGYGGATTGSSQAGNRAQVTLNPSYSAAVYEHH
jgi:opacity protein-like surface antigen